MADTIHASVNIACNNILASYKSLQAFLDIAIKSPVSILKLIKAQVEVAQKTGFSNISGITAGIMGVAADLSNYISRPSFDVAAIKNAFLCPLLTTFLSAEERTAYIKWVDDFIADAGIVNTTTQKFNNTMYSSIVKQQTFLTDTMNNLLDAEVYARINSWINVVEQSYWADLSYIHPSLKGESIMSLLNYLRMGENCLKAYCDTITKVGLTEVSDYLKMLQLTDLGGTGFRYDPYLDMPADVVEACVNAGQETQDVVNQMNAAFGSFSSNVEPVDPYKVDSWIIED